jgi:hypothetical protein
MSQTQIQYFPYSNEKFPNQSKAFPNPKHYRYQPKTLSLPNSNTPCPAAEMNTIKSALPLKNLAGAKSAKSAGLWL